MKIDPRTLQNVTGAYRTNNASPKAPSAAPASPQQISQADAVKVSKKAQEATQLRAKLKQAPEVRMDLVNKIKAQVEAGTYHVEPRKVAEKLLKSKVLE